MSAVSKESGAHLLASDNKMSHSILKYNAKCDKPDRIAARMYSRGFQDILKALLSGRDEQEFGILMKGYQVTSRYIH